MPSSEWPILTNITSGCNPSLVKSNLASCTFKTCKNKLHHLTNTRKLVSLVKCHLRLLLDLKKWHYQSTKMFRCHLIILNHDYLPPVVSVPSFLLPRFFHKICAADLKHFQHETLLPPPKKNGSVLKALNHKKKHQLQENHTKNRFHFWNPHGKKQVHDHL